jgi:hypothetical protein
MGIVVDKSITRIDQRSSGERQFCPLYHVAGGSVTAPAVGVTWLIAILRRS